MTGNTKNYKQSNWEIPKFKIKIFSKKKTNYCLCIPVINEGQKFIDQLSKMKQLAIDKMVDIIILEGGSIDGSTNKTVLKSFNVSTLLVKVGSGKLSAQLRMGYSFALEMGYKGIITVDGNNKDSFEDIPSFTKALDSGYDFVQGSRFINGGEAVNTPLMRIIAIKYIANPIINYCSGFKYTDTTNGFRGYSNKLLNNPSVLPFRNIFNSYELIQYLSVRAPQTGNSVIEIPVKRKYPKKGKTPTKINFFDHFKIIIMILKTSIGVYDPR